MANCFRLPQTLALMAGLVSAFLGVGCGGGDEEDVCVPGATESCVCPGISDPGAQACNSDGSGFGVCSCGESTAALQPQECLPPGNTYQIVSSLASCSGDCYCEEQLFETFRLNSDGEGVAMENAAVASGELQCEESVTWDGCHMTLKRLCAGTLGGTEGTVTSLIDLDVAPGGTGTTDISIVAMSATTMSASGCLYTVVITL